MALPIYTSAAFTGTTGVELAPNASVEVRSEADDSLVTLYEDRDGNSQINNPFQADAFGRFQFFAAPNADGWRITVTSGSDSHTLRFQQPMGSVAGAQASNFMMNFLGAGDVMAARGVIAIAFFAHKNGTAQTGIAANTPTKVTFGTEVFDVGGYYDATNSLFMPAAGLYRITGSLLYQSGVVDGQQYRAQIWKNGSPLHQDIRHAASTNTLTTRVDAVVEANGTDYFEIYALGAGSGDKAVSGSTIDTFFFGHAI